MKRTLHLMTILSLALILVLSATACGDGQTADDPVEDTSPAQPATGGDTGGNGGQLPQGTGMIRFENNYSDSVCLIYMTLSSRAIWGRPVVDQELKTGDSFTVREIPPGSYDLKVQDCQGNILAWTLELVVENTTDGVYKIFDPTDFLEVRNASSLALCELYARPANASAYPRNLLSDNQSIASGNSYYLGLTNAEWDIKVVACGASGKTLEVDNFLIRGGTFLTVEDE